MGNLREEVRRIGTEMRDRYAGQRRVQSFEEYLDLFERDPWRYSRDAARYLRDAFDHFGSYPVDTPIGSVRRFRLFDGPSVESPDGVPREVLVGHEDVQEKVYRILCNFVREGGANKLVLLHGPNGTAKSTFVACLLRALEEYSSCDDGAVHRINWIFPRGREGRGAIGFSGRGEEGPGPGETYAYLPDDDVAARLPCEVRDHPLLLLPLEERRKLLRAVYARAGIREMPPEWLWYGQISQKNKRIVDALLVAYRGDFSKVLAHVQVERYEISRRYRQGAVTIGPQMSVDAGERQVTADRSLGALPASLASVNLFEVFGELVDASGGLLEYADLLKRPLDAWRYLLLAIETGEVALTHTILCLNCVLIGSSNEVHLSAFKEHHEYNSFRGRIELVRMGHLLDYRQEQQIYERTVTPQIRRFIAPHATEMAALWAVLTRLRKPQRNSYDKAPLGSVAASLTPIEKAELYSKGELPERLGTDQAKDLRAGIETVVREPESWPRYEGLTGISVREMRTLLVDAAQREPYEYLSPMAVLDEIDAICKRTGDFAFLKDQPEEGGYGDPAGFAKLLRDRLIDAADDELRSSSGLVDETQYRDLFERYVTHVSSWLKGEKILNRHTGGYESPDLDLMTSVEKMLEVAGAGSTDGKAASEHRKNLINQIAAWAIDHPGEPIDYARLFPRILQRLREHYFGERRKLIETIARDIVRLVLEEGTGLDDERRARARRTLDTMRERYGYDDRSAADVTQLLVKHRYSS